MSAGVTAEHGYRFMPARFAVECDGLATEAPDGDNPIVLAIAKRP
jgi:hypothetical protein